MNESFYPLPADLAQDIENHARDVERFLSGDLTPLIFKSRRVPRGIYEQRRDGTYMVRARIPAGRMTWRQAEAMADLAVEFGSGTLHVTDRQDLQLHDLRIEDTPAIMRRMLAAGLAARGGGGNTVRNVSGCPLAGTCPAETFDVSPFADAVTGYLLAQPGSFNLPRKYKIAFSGCAADCALTQVADLGFVARVREGRAGFAVYAGGGLGARSRVADLLHPWVAATEVIRLAEAVRRVFDRQGDRQNKNRARLRFVFDRLGIEPCRQLIDEAMAEVTREGVPACGVEVNLRAGATAAAPESWEQLTEQIPAGLTILREREAAFRTIRLHVPMGFLAAADLRVLAGVARDYSALGQLRATQGQTLLVPSVRSSQLPAAAAALRAVSFDAITRTPLASFTVCAGTATCRLGLCHSRPAALACAEGLGKTGLPAGILARLAININGCPNACGHHPVGDIGLYGAAQREGGRLVPSYMVCVGARRGEGRTRLGTPVGLLPARHLPAFLAETVGDFVRQRQHDESFADWVDRLGIDAFKPRLQPHARIPAYDTDPECYRDWGQTEDFTLAGRGAGECGMGVFEVINHEVAAAKKALGEAALAGPAGSAQRFAGLMATVRALLIVRGVDTPDADESLRAFEKHFLDTGLVDAGHRSLLARARGHLQGWTAALDDQAAALAQLLQRVEYLFSTLDAALVFHPVEAAPAAAPATPAAAAAPVSGTAAEIDLGGVACPMNFVKAKLRLETLKPGDTLGVVLDDGEPVQNVPASFRNEGQEVQEINDLGNGRWRVVIRKKV